MTTLPQPPPDAPAPPPSEHALRSRRKFRRILWGILLSIPLCVLLLCWLFRPVIIRSHRNPSMVQATNNAMQIYILLVDFDQDYGSFPDATTAPAVKITTGTLPPARPTSNAALAQLIIGGFVQSEEIFFAKTKHSRKPDNIITGNNVLAPGECGFAYVPGFSTASHQETPILMTPLIPGTTKFDRKIHEGKAVILRISGSAKWETIAPDGHVYVDGMDLFDPRQPYWGGKAPIIAYPE